MQNIAITVPFEFVGNYGWIAGILSFAVIGAGWAMINACVLTVDRLTTHPLTPLMISVAMGVESSMGQSLNGFKFMPFPLILLYIAMRVSQKKSLLSRQANKAEDNMQCV